MQRKIYEKLLYCILYTSKPDREPGKEILKVEGLTKTINGEKVLDNVTFTVKPSDKIAFLADNENAKTVLFQILARELEPDAGTCLLYTSRCV